MNASSPQNQQISQQEHDDTDQIILSRRRLLQALTAASGAVAVSQTIPNQWTKPVIEVGVLPAHAQTSALFAISNAQKTFTGTNDCNLSLTEIGSSNTVTFDYVDPSGGITSAARVIFTSSLTTGTQEIDPFTRGSVTGNSSSGTISINFCTQFGGSSSVTNTVRLRNASGQETNTVTVTQPRPVGANRANGTGLEQVR